ncbi:MAG TPA: alpha/beta hydrolase [Rhizobiaceae bacterium]|nr:alpha/beta hydrolase [Rhizobiaceae bacterium]
MNVTMLSAGAPLAEARAAVIMLHGRGGSAQDILSLGEELDTGDIAFVAPQAPGGSWYPFSFLAPIAQNEPFLSDALATVGATVASVGEHIAADKIFLLGFSQGGCLALEYGARNARRYGGLIGLSAGLIGPRDTPRSYSGSLDGTPVFLGCSDIDAHIPLWRVNESAKVLRELGGAVTENIYPGMGHTIIADEIAVARDMLARP